jgi:hypothetical protein
MPDAMQPGRDVAPPRGTEIRLSSGSAAPVRQRDLVIASLLLRPGRGDPRR